MVRNGVKDFDLDVLVAASGWNAADDAELHRFIEGSRGQGDEASDDSEHGAEDEMADLTLDGRGDDVSSGSQEEDEVPQLHREGETEEEEEHGEANSDEEASGSDPDATAPVEERITQQRQPSRARGEVKRSREARNVEALVSSDLTRSARKQGQRHHGQKAAAQRTLGKAKKGSKKKTDSRAHIKAAQQF